MPARLSRQRPPLKSHRCGVKAFMNVQYGHTVKCQLRVCRCSLKVFQWAMQVANQWVKQVFIGSLKWLPGHKDVQ